MDPKDPNPKDNELLTFYDSEITLASCFFRGWNLLTGVPNVLILEEPQVYALNKYCFKDRDI